MAPGQEALNALILKTVCMEKAEILLKRIGALKKN